MENVIDQYIPTILGNKRVMIFNLPCWFSYEREKLWKDADYSTLNIANGEEEDEDETKDSFDEEDEREQKDIRYVRGDVTHPIKTCGSDAIIIHCVGECAISKTLESLQFSNVKAKVSAIQMKACAESSNLRSLAIFTVFYVWLPLSLITFLCWSLYVALSSSEFMLSFPSSNFCWFSQSLPYA